MSFSAYQPLAVYPANGVQTDFAAPDKFYDLADVRCVLVIGGREYPQVRGVDYAVLVTGQDLLPPYRYEGFLRFTVPPANGADVVPFIQPQTNQDQPFEGRPVTPRQHERVHDRAVMSSAILSAFLDRGYRSPLNAAPGLRTIVTGREGYVPTWDEFGNLIEGPTVGQIGQIVDIIPQINAVAAIAPQVVAVAAIDDEVVALYAVRAQIAALGPVAGQIATLAPFTDELQDLAPIAAQIYAVGQIDGQVVIVANNIAQVVIAANNIASINTAAANITAIIAAPDAAAAAAAAQEGAEDARDEAVALVGGVGLSVVTVGTPVPFPTATLRPGYLYMDGSTFNAATYPALYAALGNTNVLPDWRDRVARGNGTLAGAVGTFQADAMQGHKHALRQGPPATDGNTASGYPATRVNGNNSWHLTAGNDQDLPIGGPTDAGSGVPRVASETRVRAAIVSWQIKAYGSIIDPGTLNLVALEQQALRKTPMSPVLTQAEIGQVAANIGQAWEVVPGGVITVGAAVAQIDWTNLGVYRNLRLTGRFNPATANSFLSWRAGPGGVITPTDIYRCQSTSSVGTGVTTSSATGLLGGPLVSNTGNLDSAHNAAFEALFFGFNVAASATRYHSAAGGLNSSTQDYSSTYDGFRNSLSADNMLRLYASAGLIGSGSSFVLEGQRG